MRSASTPKSHLASITSKPLFMRVAESMVIFAPMSHVGCLSASSAVTCAICSAVNVLKGPPEHVSRIFSMLLSPSPTMLWNIAECSLSTGSIGTRFSRAKRHISSPATTRVSLLARHIFFLALMAWIVGDSPANPTMAVSTMSMDEDSTTSSRALLPAYTFMSGMSERASLTLS